MTWTVRGLSVARPSSRPAASDDVVLHLLPPTADLELVARALREHLDGRADQHEDKQQSHRGHDQRIDETSALRHRCDVAVARGRQGHGRVIERVDDRHVAVDGVSIAAPLDDDQQPVDQHETDRDGNPAQDRHVRQQMLVAGQVQPVIGRVGHSGILPGPACTLALDMRGQVADRQLLAQMQRAAALETYAVSHVQRIGRRVLR
jgi:hypothetical protein